MDSQKVPVGAVIGSGLLTLIGLFALIAGLRSGDLDGLGVLFFVLVLGLGLLGFTLALSRGVPHGEGAHLPVRLAELDSLKDEGILTSAEHRRKRKQLVDAWGLPEEQDSGSKD